MERTKENKLTTKDERATASRKPKISSARRRMEMVVKGKETAVADEKRAELRNLVRGYYDVQKIRIQIGNRIVANFYAKLGKKPSEKKDSIDNDAKQLLVQLMKEAKLITNAITDNSHKLEAYMKKHEGIISSSVEFEFVSSYVELLKIESKLIRSINKMLKGFLVWEYFLRDVPGCGPLMAAVIISELDPRKARYVSSFWKYAGLDVAPDGKGRSRKKEHLTDVEYVDRDGNLATKKSITFNPFLKTKLLGVLGPSFIKCKSPYSDTFYDYRHRLENHPIYKDTTKIHRYNMAVRYMIKMFLGDLWCEWRELEGLPTKPSYAEAKLGMVHGGGK